MAENSEESPFGDAAAAAHFESAAAAFPCGDGGGFAGAKQTRKKKPRVSGNENGK
jgi:hypothetical protein